MADGFNPNDYDTEGLDLAPSQEKAEFNPDEYASASPKTVDKTPWWGEVLSNIPSGAGQALSSIPSAIKFLGKEAYNQVTGEPSQVQGALWKYLDDSGARGVLSDVGRTAAESLPALGAVAFPPAAPFVPTVSAAMGTGFDYLAGDIPEGEFSKTLGERIGSYNTLGLGGYLGGKALGKLGGGLVEGRQAAKIARAESGTEQAGALGFPQGSKPTLKEIAQAGELEDAAVAAGNTKIWEGGETFNPDTLTFEGGNPKAAKLPKIKQTLDRELPKIAKEIDATVDDLTSAAETYNKASDWASDLKIKDTLSTDLPLDEIKRIEEELKLTFSTRDSSDVLRGIRKAVDEDFQDFSPQPLQKTGESTDWSLLNTGRKDSLSLKDLYQYRQNLYRSLRALKEFDTSVSAGAVVDPSKLAQNGALREGLEKLAAGANEQIIKKSKEIIGKIQSGEGLSKPLPANNAVSRVQTFSDTRLPDLLSVYHNLKPYQKIGLPRALSQSASIAAEQAPLSAVNTPDSLAEWAYRGLYTPVKNMIKPPYAQEASRNANILSRLQGATGMVGESPYSSLSTMGDVMSNVALPAGNIMAQAITQPLPRNIQALWETPTQAIPPDLLQNPDFQEILTEGQEASPEVRRKLLDGFLRDNPDAARSHFEPSSLRGFNVIQGEDGEDYLEDPYERSAYAEKIKREEKDPYVATEKLAALNEAGRIVKGGRVNISTKTSSSKKESTVTIKSQEGDLKRQDPGF